jgi:hypothetical protein
LRRFGVRVRRADAVCIEPPFFPIISRLSGGCCLWRGPLGDEEDLIPMPPDSSVPRLKSFAIALFVAALCFVQSAPAFAVNSNCVSPSPLVFSSANATPTLTSLSTVGCDSFGVGLFPSSTSNPNISLVGFSFSTLSSASTSGTTYRFTFVNYESSNQPYYTVSIL